MLSSEKQVHVIFLYYKEKYNINNTRFGKLAAGKQSLTILSEFPFFFLRKEVSLKNYIRLQPKKYVLVFFSHFFLLSSTD
jgi:hypothetical protein